MIKSNLTDDQKNQSLTENPTFCIMPWIHIHNWPDGKAYPCCLTQMNATVGDTTKQTLEEIWHGDAMVDIRKKMLSGQHVPGCEKCYEMEQHGPISKRITQNKQFAHYLDRCTSVNPEMNLVYWDIRFSNLCNLRCRTCGPPFSSNWFDDYNAFYNIEKNFQNKRVVFSGRHEHDMMDQLLKHIDHVEKIYFAGGEPLIMQEHYEILTQLIKRGRTDVRLQYNTNFTELAYKKTNILDLWNNFSSVNVGASLDAMGTRAEYIRKNCDWEKIEHNRKEMIKKSPHVDFFVSATVGVLNAWHITDFHRSWAEQGLITPEEFSVNVVQYPSHYRLDILPPSFKKVILEKWKEHLEWLKPKDTTTRASLGYETAINFMMANENQEQLTEFWNITNRLDKIRNENILEVLPELIVLKNEI